MTFIETIGISVGVYLILSYINMKFWDRVRSDEYRWDEEKRSWFYGREIENELEYLYEELLSVYDSEIQSDEELINQVVSLHKAYILAVTELKEIDDTIVIYIEGLMKKIYLVSLKLISARNDKEINPYTLIKDLISEDPEWQGLNDEIEMQIADLKKSINTLKRKYK